MRSLVILGVLLMVLGFFTYFIPLMRSADRDAMGGGNFTAVRQAAAAMDVPAWASAAALVTGLVFVLVGTAVRPRSY